MKKISLKGLDQFLYYERLDNGLDVYLLPYDNKKNYIIDYVTKFGSVDTEFIPYGEKKCVKVPDGIAHFLEHKMFEQEDGIDPFTFASKTGTSSNASTDYECTRYYFEGNKAFKENLDYLLNFVGSPYFTDDNVEKEKGIIAEEIKLYDDQVEWFLDEELRMALLKNDKHRVDIAGTIDSINKITKEDLYKTYNTFYRPSNMFIVISGSFDKDEAIKVIKENKILNSFKDNFKIERKKMKEDISVNKKEVVKKFNTSNTRIGYGIKIPIGNHDRFLFSLYVGAMLKNKFSASSLFIERMQQEDLGTGIFVTRDIIDDYLLVLITARTDKPKELVKSIKEELSNVDIEAPDLERIKKTWIASSVMFSDSIAAMLGEIVDDVISFGKVISDRVDIYRSLNVKDYNKIIRSIDFNNSSVVTIYPNKV